MLAMSWGNGDPHKDSISIVLLDEAGRLREHTKIDNLVDQEFRDEFTDILKRRRPDVIVVGGYSMATTKLVSRVKEIVNPQQAPDAGGWGESRNEDSLSIPVTYMYDDVARLYRSSKRASEEFSALTEVTRYCIGLARYTQSPLNEYAALGVDITILLQENPHQFVSFCSKFIPTINSFLRYKIPTAKLLAALERTLVDITNRVGVDINRAVADPYYQHLLPFVCGLGPRKAQVLVKKIASMVSVPSLHLCNSLILLGSGWNFDESGPVYQEPTSHY